MISGNGSGGEGASTERISPVLPDEGSLQGVPSG
jgi:hypothetical protein